jgi:aminopeptidase-like protein
MISLSRFPYAEYHTSFDNPEIIKEEKLKETKNIILEILNIIDSDYLPKRNFKGPLFLSGFGLWVDYRKNKELNRNIEQIILNLEGEKSVFEIAEMLDINFEEVLGFLQKLYEKKLVKKTYSFLSKARSKNIKMK